MDKELALKKVKIETKKSNLTKNKGITPVNIRVCQPGKNRNGFNIPKDVLEKAVKETMGLLPIIGLFDERKKDFGDHGQQMTTNANGDYYRDEPRAIGVVPEDFEVSYDDKGYLCVNGYLWTERYPQAKKAIGKGQSMELNPAMTKFGDTKNGFTTIQQTGFLALTVLGDNVEPCFKDAKIKSGEDALVFALDKVQNKLLKETEELVKELEFSFNPQEDIMIDIDAEEKDKINREKITEAIDELEDVLEDADEEDKEKIEKALKNLVSAETDMKAEPKLVILDEDAKEALQGQPEGDENIVEQENVNFAEDKKKKEEELPFEPKEKEAEAKPEAEEAKPKAQEEGDKVVEPKDDKMEKSVEDSKPEKSKGVQEGAQDVNTPQKQPASLENTEKANEVAKQRADVATMRLDEMLKGVSNTDVMKFLVDRIGEVSEFQTVMQAAIGTMMPMNNAPTEKIEETELAQEEVKAPEEVEIEEQPMGTEPKVEEEVEVKQTTPIEDKEVVEKEVEEARPEEVEAPIEKEVVKEKAEVPTEKEVVEKETEPEEEKRKKLKSLNHSLMKENAELIKENEALKLELAELKDIKTAIDTEKKEAILKEFDLSKEAKDEIRAKFDKLTLEEVEEKAVLAQYREAKEKKPGTKKKDIVFSEKVEKPVEFSLNKDSAEEEVVSVLEAIRKQSQDDMTIEL